MFIEFCPLVTVRKGRTPPLHHVSTIKYCLISIQLLDNICIYYPFRLLFLQYRIR